MRREWRASPGSAALRTANWAGRAVTAVFHSWWYSIRRWRSHYSRRTTRWRTRARRRRRCTPALGWRGPSSQCVSRSGTLIDTSRWRRLGTRLVAPGRSISPRPGWCSRWRHHSTAWGWRWHRCIPRSRSPSGASSRGIFSSPPQTLPFFPFSLLSIALLAFFLLFTLVLLSPLYSEPLLLFLVRRVKRLAFDVVHGGAKRPRHLGHFRFFCNQDCMGIRRFECLTRTIPSPPIELL